AMNEGLDSCNLSTPLGRVGQRLTHSRLLRANHAPGLQSVASAIFSSSFPQEMCVSPRSPVSFGQLRPQGLRNASRSVENRTSSEGDAASPSPAEPIHED